MEELRKNLFIIGNGFDIAHGIPSKYSDFQKYIRSLYMTKELVDKSFDDFSPWKFSVPRTNNVNGHFDHNNSYNFINILGFLDYCISRSQNPDTPYNFYINSSWWSIEDVLGNLDLREFIFGELSEFCNANYVDQEWLIYDIAECFKYLNELASMWANSIDVTNVHPINDFFRIINKDRLLPINNDLFITFNYTPTLEYVYGVREVIHVHGFAGGRVMLGHAPINDIDSFCIANSICEYKHAANVLLKATEKDTESNAQRLSTLISQKCAGITDIYSFGFSFADVDLPYISLICKKVDTHGIIWHLLDYDSPSKRNQYIDKIRHCGFNGCFETYHIKTSTFRSRKTNPYKEYIKSKKRHMGLSEFYLNQLLLINCNADYTPTIIDYILFFPRIFRCIFWHYIEKAKRKKK